MTTYASSRLGPKALTGSRSLPTSATFSRRAACKCPRRRLASSRMPLLSCWLSRSETFERLAQGTCLSAVQQTGSLHMPSKAGSVEQDAATKSASDRQPSSDIKRASSRQEPTAATFSRRAACKYHRRRVASIRMSLLRALVTSSPAATSRVRAVGKTLTSARFSRRAACKCPRRRVASSRMSLC